MSELVRVGVTVMWLVVVALLIMELRIMCKSDDDDDWPI